MVEATIKDSVAAENAVRRHFDGLYGTKLHEVKFEKVWLQPGNTQDVWQVEGALILMATLRYKRKHFRIELDNITGNVVGFEENDTK